MLPESNARGIGAAAKRAGFTSLFAWARPWQHHDLYVSLGYEPRTASIDFQGALL